MQSFYGSQGQLCIDHMKRSLSHSSAGVVQMPATSCRTYLVQEELAGQERLILTRHQGGQCSQLLLNAAQLLLHLPKEAQEEWSRARGESKLCHESQQFIRGPKNSSSRWGQCCVCSYLSLHGRQRGMDHTQLQRAQLADQGRHAQAAGVHLCSEERGGAVQ